MKTLKNNTQKKLDDLSIYEVRDIARNMGVRSPSSKKKNVLISEIENIISGKDSPYVKPTKKGRPARAIVTMDEILDIIAPNDLSDASIVHMTRETKPYDMDFDMLEGLSVAQPIEPYDGVCEDIEEVSGTIDVSSNGYGILRVKDFVSDVGDCYIPTMLMRKYKLTNGDRIEGLAKVIRTNMPRTLQKVLVVNNFDVEDYKSPDTVISHANLNKNSTYGAILVYNEGNFDVKTLIPTTDEVYEINFDKSTSKVLEFGIDMAYNMSLNDQIISMYLVLNRAKRRANLGHNTALVVSSFTKLITTLDRYNRGKLEIGTLSNDTLQELKDIIFATGDTNGAKFSIVFLEDSIKDNPLKDIITLEFEPIMNKIIGK